MAFWQPLNKDWSNMAGVFTIKKKTQTVNSVCDSIAAT